MTLGYDFRSAVQILQAWLNRQEARQAKFPSNRK
jgi:hypothetical protein